MQTPFTTEQFFQVFDRYNLSVFPIQLLIIILGIAAIILILSRAPFKNTWIGGFLGLLWIWIGVAYHIVFFSTINKVAYLFGAVFILQGIFFLIEALIKKRIVFEFRKKLIDYVGYVFILYGLIIYPVLSFLSEKSLHRIIAPGLPCPSTILTFGFLILTNRKFPKYLIIIPSLWAIIGTSAAFNFGVYQDYLMIFAVIVADIYLITRKKPIEK